jgi:dephospho-CoA kinase
LKKPGCRQKALDTLIKEVESASSELQSEASLIFAMDNLPPRKPSGSSWAMKNALPETLGVQAWQDAAIESTPAGSRALFFKQLRQDRVLRPI